MKSRELVVTNGRAAFYACMWDDLRNAAMNCGWALGLHGSLSKDMDIMAMPWCDGAITDEEMINELRLCFAGNEIKVYISDMPNNRRVFTLSIWGDFYLDINIIKQPTDVIFETIKKRPETTERKGMNGWAEHITPKS